MSRKRDKRTELVINQINSKKTFWIKELRDLLKCERGDANHNRICTIIYRLKNLENIKNIEKDGRELKYSVIRKTTLDEFYNAKHFQQYIIQ